MSSRVRLMLQDFANNMAWTGKRAFAVLDELYKNWALDMTNAPPTEVMVRHWNHVTERWANEHPFVVSRFLVPPPNEPNITWLGPGYYVSSINRVEVTKGPLEALPQGPKWLVALAMWERLAPNLSSRYRLFVSRDSRRQNWRRSLCNPHFQNWGFKLRPLSKTKAKPKAPPRDFATELVRASTGQTTAPKPRVGIWN